MALGLGVSKVQPPPINIVSSRTGGFQVPPEIEPDQAYLLKNSPFDCYLCIGNDI